MSIKRLWNAIIVIGFMVLTGGLSSATWTPQEPSRPPAPEEERKRLLDRLSKQRQEIQGGSRQPSNPSAAPPVTAPSMPIPAAADTAQREGGKVLINYENADLYDVINDISTMLGLTPLIVDSEVKGSVNIISSGPMAKADVLPLFNLILKNNNAALIKQGDMYQIVPISSAVKKGVEVIELPTSMPGNPPDSQKAPATPSGPVQPAIQKTPAATAPGKETSKASKLATYVIRVQFVPVKDLIEPLRLFLTTEGGVIMSYERLNMLIITDYADSVARAVDIIRMLDNGYLDPDLVELIKIKNNASADVAEDLKKIFGSGSKDSATGISFVSLDRLNAIFVVAGSKVGLEEMRHWIAELDAESGRNFQTYVYVVENSTASSIAMMLAAFYGGEETTSYDANAGGWAGVGAAGGANSNRNAQPGSFGNSGSNRGGTSQPRTANSLANQSYNQGDQSNNSGQNGGLFGSNQRLGPQLNPARSVTSQILRGGEFTGLKDTVRMVVDDINNSLYIQATSVDYAYILETIKKMDVLPRQARIDARVFEVELNDTLNFGVKAFLEAKGTTTNGTTLTTGSLVDGLLKANTFAFVGDSRQIITQITALKEKTNIKILESPSILALDGTQASFTVGQEYPYSGGSYTSSVGGSTTNVQYRETGVTLLVLPRISASGTVTMDITQEVSSFGTNVLVGDLSYPTFPKASVTNTFYVKDGETVAIAGLIRDSTNNGRSGIPFLSEIPILGSLFGTTKNEKHRTELIILITPHVIQSHEKLQEMSQELKDSLRSVRTMVDDKDKERAKEIQDAQKDRDKQEQKLSKEEKKKSKK
jgi:general secretion pathway protein D